MFKKQVLSNFEKSKMEYDYNDTMYNYDYVDFVCFPFNYSGSENATKIALAYLYTDMDVVFHKFFLPVILFIGIATNCAFLFVVYRIPSMRTVVNQYLTHIAIGDLLFLITAIGKKMLRFASSKNIRDSGVLWGHGLEISCHAIMYTTIFASVLIMTLVGFERYFAVCRPTRIYAAATKQRTVKVLLTVVWSLSGVLALTTIPAVTRVVSYCVVWPDDPKFEGISSEFKIYTFHSTTLVAYILFVQTVPFFVVMGINSVLYVRIITNMSGRLEKMQSYDLDTQTNIKLRNKVAIMLIINGVTFFALTFPFQFVSFVNGIVMLLNRDEEFGGEFKTFFQILLYCNSLVNPIIYNVSNSRYRSALMTAFGINCGKFRCHWRPQRYHLPLDNSNAKECPTKNTVMARYGNRYMTDTNGHRPTMFVETTETQC